MRHSTMYVASRTGLIPPATGRIPIVMTMPSLLMQEVSLPRRRKRERIALLESGEMRTVLYEIDVTDATLAQELGAPLKNTAKMLKSVDASGC